MSRLFTCFIRSLPRNQKLFFSSQAERNEFTVSQFCKLNILCPFNIKVRPLDVHQYPNSDKLLVQLLSDTSSHKAEIQYLQNKDNFYITSSSKHVKGVSCLIDAPIKSDLNITTTGHGSINIKQFKGDQIILKSDSGDIVSENCVNSVINYSTQSGNIVSNGTLHASDIQLQTGESGCIMANNLQALKLSLKTQDGDVQTKSSYCDESRFETQTGKLILNNVHKNCTVNILDCGILQMTGFDGTLNVNMKSGEADIQLTKLHEISKINVDEKSPILIRISETVIDNARIETTSPTVAVASAITMLKNKSGDTTSLIPLSNKYSSQLFITALSSHIVLDEASWADLLGLNKRNY